MSLSRLKLTRVIVFVVVCVAGAIAAAANFHVTVQPVKREQVYVRVPGKATHGQHAERNGKITQAECRAIKRGTSFDSLIETYGKPSGQSYDDVYLWGPWYPVTDASKGTLCQLDSVGGNDTVGDKHLDVQL